MDIILAVDDNANNLHLIRGILKASYEVHTAQSGEKALAFLEKTKPDLILLDIEMPGMNGREVIRRLKESEEYCSIPVIFLTGKNGRGTERNALRLGATDYMQKPLYPEIVKARVNMHLELQHYKNRLDTMVKNKTQFLESIQDITLDLFAHAVESRDEETGGHIDRTTNYVKLLIQNLKKLDNPEYQMDTSHEQSIIRSAKLHDIGKIGVPDKILQKPSKLSDNEFEIIKEHSQHGADLLEHAVKSLGADSFFDIAQEISRFHHEKWDGTGYPLGLKGKDIPLPARIMAVADVYDALISKRQYKPAYSHERSCEIIINGKGTHFDPVIIDVFETIKDEFNEISKKYQ